MAVKVLSECRLIEIVLKHGQNSKGDKMNKMLTSTMCLIAVMSAMAMPTAKEQKAANARVKVIMSGFRDQSDSVQADLAMKASESAKTERAFEGQTLMVGLGWWGCAKLWYNVRHEAVAQLQDQPEQTLEGFRGSDPNGGVRVVGLCEIMV